MRPATLRFLCAGLRRPGERESAFYDGILAALAVVDAHGQETVGQSIVNTVDKAKLFARADAYDRKVLASLGIKP